MAARESRASVLRQYREKKEQGLNALLHMLKRAGDRRFL